PCSVANATELRSTEVNIAPRARNAGDSVTSPAAGRLGSFQARPARPSWRGAGRGSGSVRRCSANSSVPVIASRLAVPTPLAANTWVASSVTSAGPMTKMSSSLTDSRANATCSRVGSPPSTQLHLVRTMLLVDGMDAPATRPVTSKTANGARNSAQAMKVAKASAKTATWPSSTRPWPKRSERLAIYGPSTEYPMEPAPATVPAAPYRPVSDTSRSTVPSPYMDIDIRPTNAVDEK